MRDDIIEIIAEYLDIPPSDLDENKSLEALQIDSLDFAEIMFEIEEKLNTSLMFEMQDHKNEIRTLGDALRLIEAQVVAGRAVVPTPGHA